MKNMINFTFWRHPWNPIYKIKFTTAKMPKNNNVRPKITVNIMLNGSKLMDKNLFLYKSNHVITTIEITTK